MQDFSESYYATDTPDLVLMRFGVNVRRFDSVHDLTFWMLGYRCVIESVEVMPV